MNPPVPAQKLQLCDGSCQERLCSKMKQELRFFSFLNTEELDEIAPYFECRKVSPGQYLWNQHDPGDFVALLVNGRVEVSVQTEFKGNIVLGIYGPGASVGELSLLDGSLRSEAVLALDQVEMIFLTRDCFQRLIADHPATGVRLLEGLLLTVSRRLKKSFERLASIF